MVQPSDNFPASNLSGLNTFLRNLPGRVDVRSWRHEGLDLWPLFLTAFSGLGLHAAVGYQRRRVRVGGRIWKTAILADYWVRPVIQRFSFRSDERVSPTVNGALEGKILFVGSKSHGRDIGRYRLIPVLDTPAIALQSQGEDVCEWLIDVDCGDPEFCRFTQQVPVSGIAHVLRKARADTFLAPHSLTALKAMPTLVAAIEELSCHLKLQSGFLMLWLSRQVDLMISAEQNFGAIFDGQGRPSTLFLVASGYWWSAGLAAAARKRGIPVVEIEHGAEGPAALSAQGQAHHFSIFNSAPQGLLSWSTIDRNDKSVLCIGPLGNLLPALVERAASSLQGPFAELLQVFQSQQRLLESRANQKRPREILISSDDVSSDRWITTLVDQMPDDVFCWIRRHPGESTTPLADADKLDAERYDIDLASTVLLPMLLSRVDAHITRFSAVTLEAAAMGVPTFALHEYASDLFARHVPSHLFSYVKQPADIAVRLGAAKPRGRSDAKTGDELETKLAAFIKSLKENL